MSELSAEEKRRLLRERRQAKMSQGKATERLNNILTKGSSVNSESAKSVLEAKESALAQDSTNVPVNDTLGSSKSAPFSKSPVKPSSIDQKFTHPSQSHDDPEVPDISSLLQTGRNSSMAEENDMDAIMQKIFAGAGGSGSEPKNAEEATSKFFAEMMKTMGENPDAIPETPENASYQTKLAVYHEYQQKSWKARFLIIRLFVHTANFVYYYLNYSGFVASSHVIVRDVMPAPGVSNFMTVFVSAEIAIISSYFLILSSSGVLGSSSRNHPASKMLSMASAIFPQASAYQAVLDNVLVYWGGASIILGDLMLVVVMFGLASIFA